MTTYVSFSISNRIFPTNCGISKSRLTVIEAQLLIEHATVVAAQNTFVAVEALLDRYGIDLKIPDVEEDLALQSGDAVVVITVMALPRRLDVARYTRNQIAQSFFQFSLYEVLAVV